MNIKQFKPKDLSGEEVRITDLNKLIGNAMYFASADISVCEIARKIYNEEDFENSELLIESAKVARNLAPWLVEQMVAFFEAAQIKSATQNSAVLSDPPNPDPTAPLHP